MGVTLRVIGPNSRMLGDQATKVFTAGGTIGRGDRNDWVLPDANRFISTVHAEVVPGGDGVLLVDKSVNGTFVNLTDQPIGHGNSHRLQDGDRIRIGDYEIVVSLAAEPAEPGGELWPGDTGRTPAPPPPAPATGFPESDLVSHRSVDPLDLLPGDDPDPFAGHRDGATAGGGTGSSPGFGGYSRPQPVHDPLAPATERPDATPTPSLPAVTLPPSGGEAFPAEGPIIGEDWDRTTMPPHPSRPAAPARTASARPPEPPAIPPEPAILPPEPPASTVPPAPAVAGVPPAAAARAEDGLDGLVELFQAAGLDPATARAVASTENARTLGIVLRVVIQGMMEILSARAQIKNQFRVNMTQIKPAENNPLKFCVGPEDALQRLFVQRGNGFLGPAEAFGEAVEDLKVHQLAMMAGMRAAFDHVMARFDPQNLQKEFDRGLRRPTLLQPLNKTKYWDMLTELYEEINRDGDANFSRLFGDEFACAYELQMERLRRGS